MKATGRNSRLKKTLKKQRRPRIVIEPMEGFDGSGKIQFHWFLLANNNKKTSGNHGHCSVDSAKKGIESVKKDIMNAEIIVRK